MAQMCPKNPWRTAEKAHRSGTWWRSSGSLGWHSLLLPGRKPANNKNAALISSVSHIIFFTAAFRADPKVQFLLGDWFYFFRFILSDHYSPNLSWQDTERWMRIRCCMFFAPVTLPCSNRTHRSLSIRSHKRSSSRSQNTDDLLTDRHWDSLWTGLREAIFGCRFLNNFRSGRRPCSKYSPDLTLRSWRFCVTLHASLCFRI